MSAILSFLTRTLLKGLAVILPVVIGVWILTWLYSTVDNGTNQVLRYFWPELTTEIPGIGFAVGVGLLFTIGLLTYHWLAKRLVHASDRLMRRIPLFGSVYAPVRDLMDLVGGDMSEQLGKPVLLTMPATGLKCLGFVTAMQAQKTLPGLDDGAEEVVVYLPWSLQIGGFTVVVAKEDLTELDMSVDQAMRWALTAGLSAPTTSAAGTDAAATARPSPAE